MFTAVLAAALAESPALADPDPAEVEVDGGDGGDGAEPARPPTGSLQVGAGFSSDDGFIAAAALRQPNLFGRGQELSLSARMSERRQLFLLHFGEPHLADSAVGLGVDLYQSAEEWPGFARSATGGRLTLARPLAAHLRGFVGYRLEEVSIEPDPAAAPAGAAPRLLEPGDFDPALLMRGGLVSALGAGVVYDSRDRALLPRRGTYAGARIERADRALGSQLDLTRAAVFAGHHLPLGPLTLHLGGAVEAVTSRDPRGVPLAERLQLDGASELRGFAPGSLGPAPGGVALGGNLKATGRAELEFPIAERLGLSGSVFFDAGAVMDLEGRSGSGFGRSVGAALTWRSPIGPLQVGVAQPLDGAGGPAFFFGLGITF